MTITVYLYNAVEDEWSFLNTYSRAARKAKDIADIESTADGFFLATAATAADFVYISPKPIAAGFQAYARSLFKYKNGSVITPQGKTHQLCLDLLKDKTSFARLLALLKPYQQVNLLSYSASPWFLQLAAALKRAGVPLITPEAPGPDAYWTVNFFGSKSGIRQLAGPLMPEGLICFGRSEASRIAAAKFIKNRGVVIKINNGSSSNGLRLFRQNDLPDTYPACVSKLEAIFSREAYWEKFPIIVEDLINVNPASSDSFPNIEFKINPGGRIERLFYGFMAVTDKGEYYGMDVNAAILPDRLKQQLLKIGFWLAQQFAAAGYRGHFDIDMIIAKNGRLYVSETNTRNTGWTDIYKVVKKLAGKNWFTQVYVLNREYVRLPARRWANLDRLLTRLAPLLYSPPAKTGIVINSQRYLRSGYLYYTVIAPDKTTALAYQRKMFQRLRQ